MNFEIWAYRPGGTSGNRWGLTSASVVWNAVFLDRCFYQSDDNGYNLTLTIVWPPHKYLAQAGEDIDDSVD